MSGLGKPLRSASETSKTASRSTFRPLLGGVSQVFDIVELAQLLVECRERYVSNLASGFKDHAIGEAEPGPAAESSQSSRDHFGILQHQVTMVEQHIDGRGKLLVRQLENRVHHPNHLHKHNVGNPGALGNERLGSSGLTKIVSRKKTNDDIGVNRAHVA